MPRLPSALGLGGAKWTGGLDWTPNPSAQKGGRLGFVPIAWMSWDEWVDVQMEAHGASEASLYFRSHEMRIAEQ
eukprot:scaffold256_cov121-Isochrysis_galbana.AAC.8